MTRPSRGESSRLPGSQPGSLGVLHLYHDRFRRKERLLERVAGSAGARILLGAGSFARCLPDRSGGVNRERVMCARRVAAENRQEKIGASSEFFESPISFLR